jgi:zinc protease
MMFKGTPRRRPGEFNKRVAAAGGRDNAFTSRDYTAYFQQVPKEKAGEMMQLEADRMRHLNVDPRSSRRRSRSSWKSAACAPTTTAVLLFEQMNAVAFQAHPYRRPIIGWMNDLENMTAAGCQATGTERWYVPNNAYVVIVGDVDHKDVFALAEKYYGRSKARALPARKPQTSRRRRAFAA